MGSLENGGLLKKDQQQSNHYNNSFGKVSSFSKQHRDRSRFTRLFFPKRLGYLQWISTIIVFSLLLVVFQAFLPGSVEENPGGLSEDLGLVEGDFVYLKSVIDEVDFGEDLMFGPNKLLDKFKKDAVELNQSFVFGERTRFGYRKPKLAMVSVKLLILCLLLD